MHPGLFETSKYTTANRKGSDAEDGWTGPKGDVIVYPLLPGVGHSLRMRTAVQGIKRGTYNGTPATLVVLTFRPSAHRKRRTLNFFVTIVSEHGTVEPLILAYGPKAVSIPSRRNRREVSLQQALFDSRNVVRCSIYTYNPRSRGIPYRLRLALLIGHKDINRDFQLHVAEDPYALSWPFLRNPVTAVLNINAELSTILTPTTCARSTGEPCRGDCTDFSKDHMTREAWKNLVFTQRDLQIYDILPTSGDARVKSFPERSN